MTDFSAIEQPRWYVADLYCRNCGWDQREEVRGAELGIPVGQAVADTPCPICEVASLVKNTFSRAPRRTGADRG